jgi:hypothetical protein
MSDPIAEAAASLSDAAPSSTEPQQPAPEVAPAGEPSSSPSSGEAGSGEAGNADAGTSPAGAAMPASTGNVLVNAAPVVDGPNVDTGTPGSAVPEISSSAPLISSDANAVNSGSQATGAEAGDELPRESHLMLIEAKFANALAKLHNAERVSVDELEAIYVHIKAVI